MVWWDISLPISERKYDQTLSTCLISQDRPEPGYFWAMVKTVFLIFSLKGGAHPPKKNNKIQIHLLGIRIRRNPIHDGGMTRDTISCSLMMAHTINMIPLANRLGLKKKSFTDVSPINTPSHPSQQGISCCHVTAGRGKDPLGPAWLSGTGWGPIDLQVEWAHLGTLTFSIHSAYICIHIILHVYIYNLYTY